MKRKIALLLTAALLVLPFAGCGSNEEAATEQPKEETTTEETVSEEPAEDAAQEEDAADDSAEDAAQDENAADSSAEDAEAITLNVFAAASMTETLTEIGDKYMEANPNVTLQFNFDSSGTLKTQIEEGAECDVFISAAQKQMDQLDIECDETANPDRLDYIDDSTRFDLLENKVALAVPEGNPKNINSYDDMAAGLKDGSIFMAIGNEDVPVGQYTLKIFDYFGLSEEELADKGCLTYGSNVKEVTTQVSEGTVDCGVIYQTDAYSAGLTIVDTATEEMCGQVIYPAAVCKSSANKDAAKAFLEELKSKDSSAVFEGVGFTPLN